MDAVEAVALAMLNGKRAREGWPPLAQIDPGFIDGDEWRLEAADALSAARPLIAAKWQPIETAPKDNRRLILYFPSQPNKNGTGLPAMVKVERYPVSFPREPTHWQPLPAPPTAIKETIR